MKLPRKILYICDQKKCKRCSARDGLNDGWNCIYTEDISHAKNYSSVPPNRVLRNKKKFKHDIWPMPIDTSVYMEKEAEDE